MSLIPRQAFSTPRLHMRPLGETDEGLYGQLYTDPKVMRHIGAPLSVEAARRNFVATCRRAADPDSTMRLWVISEHGAPPMGILASIQHAGTADSVELGIMLVAAAQGRGFAVEALAALTDLAFVELPRCRVWTRHASSNIAVISLMHALGFERAGPTAESGADWRWQMSRDSWQARRRKPCAVVLPSGNG